MRSLVFVLPASLLFIASAHGQALTEHAAAAAGAAIGTGAGKSLSNSMTTIFGETDKETAKAAKPDTKKQAKPVTNPAPDPLAAAKSKPSPVANRPPDPDPLTPSLSHSSTQPRTRRKPAPQAETASVTPAQAPAIAVTPIPAMPPVAEPIVKVPTVQDVASIKIGATENDLVSALGQPSSRVIIPDDDGHLREICQYWANGRVLGTIRLDNGQVASVEPRPEN